MNSWLVRTAHNIISGPFDKAEVCKMILSGQLGLEDEVCEANGYWISIHERAEIFQHLGIQLPQKASDSEDGTTETHITPDDGPTDSEIPRPPKKGPK